MIVASKNLKNYIELQKDKSELAEKLNISRQMLYNIIGGDVNISEKLRDTITGVTGFDFETAFEVKE